MIAEPTPKIDRAARRNVAIAGPVHTDFSRNCAALGLVQEQVLTGLVAGWNRRAGRRVLKRLREHTARLEACLPAGSGPAKNETVSREA